MNYCVILNAFAPDIEDQCRKTGTFLQDLSFTEDTGTTIILSRSENTEKACREKWMELISTGFIFFILLPAYHTETILELLIPLVLNKDLCLFPGSFAGDELCVRLAARCKGSSLCGVLQVTSENETALGSESIPEAIADGKPHTLLASKKIYSGNMIGHFELCKKPFCISLDRSLEEHFINKKIAHTVIDITYTEIPARILKRSVIPVETDNSLADAPFVIVGGRGLNHAAAAGEAALLASELGAEFAGSRPAAMNAWVPMDRLIGVSGHMIHPELCILLGVSGAPALYSGIEKSRQIIAINTDETAPIIQKSDAAIIHDGLDVLRELVRIKKEDHHEA